jgi:hypothetical protein
VATKSEQLDLIAQLQALADMRVRELLTEREFDDLKSEFLSGRAGRES